MKFLAAAGLVGACLATSPLLAADLFESAPPPMDSPAQASELGTNWYIRGDIGYGRTSEATVVPNAGLFPSIGNQPIGDAFNPVPATRGNFQSTTNAMFSAGVGYRINDWLRVEGSWTFSNGPGYGTQQTVYCPEVANAVSNQQYTNPVTNPVTGQTTYTQTAVPVGYQYDFTSCNGNLHVTQYNNTGLAMAYADIGHWGMINPYIGVGVGMNVNTISGKLNFNQTDTGANYTGPQVVGAAPGQWVVGAGTDAFGFPAYRPLPRPAPTSGAPQPVGPANWSRTISQTKYSIAASAAAGVGFQISQSATLDIGYHVTTLDLFAGFKNLQQSVMAGVRYNLN